MSNPLAVSVLSKLTSYYTWDDEALDSLGPNDITMEVLSGYEAGGKFGGNRLASGSRGQSILASTIPVTTSSGTFFVGGWLYYTTSTPQRAEFGLANARTNQNEVLVIDTELGYMAVFGWETAATTYVAINNEPVGLDYFFTVQVEDSVASTATSEQKITITDDDNPLLEGWYFAIGQYENGTVTLYNNGRLGATATADLILQSPITRFQVGNPSFNVNTIAALSGTFFGDSDILTEDEIEYLYNDGVGKSLTDIQADAA